MKLSTKGRYATRAMLDLALHYGEGPILLRDIARRQEISERYLEHVMIPLKTIGLVRSARGARGGFVLAKPPSDIKLDEIVECCEGALAPVECANSAEACNRAGFCAARDLWIEMGEAIRQVLQSRSLQDLAERQKQKERLW